MAKSKKAGTELGMKTFTGEDGEQYLVFRSGDKFHVFVEMEAKEAARKCRTKAKQNDTQAMWKELWNRPEAI